MKRLFFLFPCLLVACGPKTEAPLWPDERTARIMADLYTAEAGANALSGYPRDSLTQIYYRQVFEMHGITMAEYENNLRLLSLDVPRLGAVLDSAQAILKKKMPPPAAPPKPSQ